nr:MAG: matrix protein [Adumi ohlsrhavirus]
MKIVIKISAEVELKFRKPPKDLKEFIQAMELLKDDYRGYIANQEFIFLFYILSGFICKYINKVGNFYIYRGYINGVFNVKMHDLEPIFPISYDYQGDGIGPIPDLVISFYLFAETSNMSPNSLSEYIIARAPKEYKRRNQIKMSIFDNFPISVSVHKEYMKLGKKRSK